MYERRLRDNYRQSLFLAEYQGRTVVVKFCERYGEDAPRVLANAGLAPRLEFRHRDLPQSVLDDIERALGKLHGAMLVYGDMRRPNIMVVKKSKCRNDDSDSDSDLDEWRGLLIDFDWSGRVGVVKYPPTLNTCGEIKWAKGVEPATTIRTKHDRDMLERIIDGIDE